MSCGGKNNVSSEMIQSCSPWISSLACSHNLIFKPQTKSGSSNLDKNRIYHRSAMQTEKSQPEGKRIMPESRFTEFPALAVGPRVGISRSASETDV